MDTSRQKMQEFYNRLIYPYCSDDTCRDGSMSTTKRAISSITNYMNRIKH